MESRPPTTLRQRRKEELRERIITDARTLFMQGGYEAFSMRKLAEKIGCSAGNIYLYFRSRDELFRCLVDESFDGLNQSILKPRRRGGDPVQRLRRGLRAYVEFGLRQPDAYRMAFLVRRPDADGPVAPNAAFDVLRNIVGECIQGKRFRAIDVELASQSLWIAVHGLTSLFIQLPEFPWVAREKLITTVIDNAVASFTRTTKGRS
jgi:AcrR family transcriptional regulator